MLSEADRRKIDELLSRAHRLQEALPPLLSLQETYNVLNECALGKLKRHPEVLDIYEKEFTPFITERCGSMANYLLSQLSIPDGNDTIPVTSYWTRDVPYHMRLNDWRYAIPLDFKHWVVWTPLPVAHRDAVLPTRQRTPSETWALVEKQGLSGFVGVTSVPNSSALQGLGSEKDGPGREVQAWVEEHFPSHTYESGWFVNPPSLQSVPNLGHFHVLARKKG